ncbi:MAG TPA: cytochrome P450, partial [Acidimicrobiales bacterium]|nr:cytochrome P450 [Acidimicrobiales bacterium]
MSATLPPGPPLPAFLQVVLMFWRPERFLELCARRYGRAFTLRLGRIGTYVYLTDPEDIRAVFRGDAQTFHAGEANGLFLEPVLGSSSVLVTDGPVHQRQRRLMMPAFHGDSVATLAPVMAEIAAHEIDTWPVGATFACRPRLSSITLEVILRTVIGAEDEVSLRGLREALPPLVDLDLLALMQFALPQLRSKWPWKRFRAIEERANAVLLAEIIRSRADPDLESRSDVLSKLVQARDDTGAPMTD